MLLGLICATKNVLAAASHPMRRRRNYENYYLFIHVFKKKGNEWHQICQTLRTRTLSFSVSLVHTRVERYVIFNTHSHVIACLKKNTFIITYFNSFLYVFFLPSSHFLTVSWVYIQWRFSDKTIWLCWMWFFVRIYFNNSELYPISPFLINKHWAWTSNLFWTSDFSCYSVMENSAIQNKNTCCHCFFIELSKYFTLDQVSCSLQGGRWSWRSCLTW